MYELYVPIMCRERTEEQWKVMIEQLKRINPQLIYLTYMRVLCNDSLREKSTAEFCESKKRLEEAGFKVAAWFYPTIGYGSVATGDFYTSDDYREIMGVEGNTTRAICPMQDSFCQNLSKQFADLVKKSGVDHILLEDDFTLTGGKIHHGIMGCCCDAHMEELSNRIGRVITRQELKPLLIEGPNNPVREAFRELMDEGLCKITNAIEKAVHTVDPDVRIGLSANSASYHIEGAEIRKLAKIVAGKNKPFMRITGAPYWLNGPSLNSIIETIRAQSAWCKEEGIDVMTEADSFPRPRFIVSAAQMEMYDLALHADGNSQSVLKYMLDYTSNANYETGYIDHHVYNQPHYEEIEKRFTGKKNVGLRVLEKPYAITDMDFGDDFDHSGFQSHGYLPLMSQWFVTDNAIPTTYDSKDGAAICWGPNAKFVTEEDLKNGLILDVHAARILQSKGIDVGFVSIEEVEKPSGEYFVDEKDSTVASTERPGGFFRFTLKENAKVLSYFFQSRAGLGFVENFTSEHDSFPACYLYENANHQRFMVYTFAPTKVKIRTEWHMGLFRNYYRQKQLIKGYEWLCGKPLPAVSTGNPYLYLICKEDGDELTVGVWNIFPDAVLKPEFVLQKEYQKLDTYNCKGKLEGKVLKLNQPIAPYSFICFTVE